MRKNVAFTICATNYVGLGKVLEKSIYKYYDDLDFYIIVADEPGEEVRKQFDDNVLIGKDVLDYPGQKWYEMAFKYNLTEFCTAIKPASILFLLEKGYERCLYFDPDILVYSSLSVIYDGFNKYDAIITPHITTPEIIRTSKKDDHDLLFAGAYNLGFVGVKACDKTDQVMRWWKKRLEDYCFMSQGENLFTDQKWIDILPSFYGNRVLISRHLGLNAAPWNFHERYFFEEGGKMKVRSRLVCDGEDYELVFVHYSGYNYKELLKGNVIQNNIKELKLYEDTKKLMSLYGEAFGDGSLEKYIDNKYTYNYFNDGKPISGMLRGLYRRYQENTGYQENPFVTGSYIWQQAVRRKLITMAKPPTYQSGERKNAKKVTQLNKLFSLLYNFIGPDKYYLLVLAMRRYSIWGNHSFLISKKGDNYIFRNM